MGKKLWMLVAFLTISGAMVLMSCSNEDNQGEAGDGGGKYDVADFKPRLTVGEMRGRVLMLSRQEYAKQPIGGYCYGWVYDKELEKQTKGRISI